MVLRVDKEKGYIDLSKRRVSPEDIAAAEERYNKSKMVSDGCTEFWAGFGSAGRSHWCDLQVHSIMRHVAETASADLEQLYVQIGWPLYKLYGHAFDALKSMVQEPDAVLQRLVEVRSRSPYMVGRFDGLWQPTSAWL